MDKDQATQNSKIAQKRMGRLMYGLMWMLVLVIMAFIFSGVLDRQHNPNNDVASQINEQGLREVVLQRNKAGHYVVSGSINDQPVVFMLDTGASDVSVPAHIADTLGLRRGPEVTYRTANGSVVNFATVLESVGLGNIRLNQIRASINPHTDSDDVLLGMTFLKHLDIVQRGEILILRQNP